MSETQTFGLVEMDRNIERAQDQKHERRFLDFSVGGKALYPAVIAEGYDNITPLWLDADPHIRREGGHAIDRLLGEAPGDAPSGRVSIYVCSECGDLGCGALTVKLSVDADVVHWADRGYQRSDDDAVHPVTSEAFGDMRFDRAEYEEVLEIARVRVSEET